MTNKEQKIALVTGASRGIGAAIAQRLANDGFAVVINYASSSKEADELVLSLEAKQQVGAYHMGGIIYGLFGKADAAATDENRKVAADSLAVLADEAKPMGIRLAMEILNRYETNMFNTVDEAIAFVKRSGSDNLFLHLDTFHMNMEETNMLEALKRSLPYLVYFEMDQNDRGLLDRGAIDFGPMLQVLKENSYREIIGAEAFSSAVNGPDVLRGVCAWRALFTDGDQVADSANAVLRPVFGPSA